MFRLLKWGFQVLILCIVLGALHQGYQFLVRGQSPELPLTNLWIPLAADELRYRGFDWQQLSAGQRVSGTDIVFQGMENQEAIFQFPDGRSPRRVGDPLNYHGLWAGLPQTDFTRTGRIIRLTTAEVFLVSWYALTIEGATPVQQVVPWADVPLYTVMLRTDKGHTVPGTTLLYQGRDADSGAALIEGQAGDERAQFQVMSSVNWSGQLRNDLYVRYNLRVLFYTDSFLQLGGTAALIHPP